MQRQQVQFALGLARRGKGAIEDAVGFGGQLVHGVLFCGQGCLRLLQLGRTLLHQFGCGHQGCLCRLLFFGILFLVERVAFGRFIFFRIFKVHLGGI